MEILLSILMLILFTGIIINTVILVKNENEVLDKIIKNNEILSGEKSRILNILIFAEMTRENYCVTLKKIEKVLSTSDQKNR